MGEDGLATRTVIVKLSSQTVPIDAVLDQAIIRVLRRISSVDL
ncbi:MAG TPA: hypothetical protein VL202_00910 [Pararhizobium sp.]|nr:hypothetical protein [Pararhizobium sp.]HTO29730.1 hypothetical protein [Pararhizobium sp.]